MPRSALIVASKQDAISAQNEPDCAVYPELNGRLIGWEIDLMPEVICTHAEKAAARNA